MRYETDLNGYITCVFWGCNSGFCTEYTGEVPVGYSSLAEWEAYATINAYYIDGDGNLVLDAEKEAELEILAAQQAIDYAPVVHKELYAQQEVLESQYLKTTSISVTPSVTDAKNIPPAVTVRGVSSGKVRIFAQTRQMLRNDMVGTTVSGVTFEKLASGMVNVTGTATEDIEYTLAGSSVNTEPLFALLKDKNYYLWSTNLECEFRCLNGGSIEQVYLGTGGVISLSETKEVTHVVIKIPEGTTVSKQLAPTLHLGSLKGAWADNITKITTIDLTDFEIIDTENADLSISGGLAILRADEKISIIGQANVQLINGDNFLYTNQGNTIEIEYSKNIIDVESLEFLQGKSTTTDRFMVLEDGSIRANNGYFGGEVNSEAGLVGGWHIEEDKLWSYITPPNEDFVTSSDVSKIQNYILGIGTLTDAEKTKYDFNGDGKINSVDSLYALQLVQANMSKNAPGKLLLNTNDWRDPIKIIDGYGDKIVSFGIYGVNPGPTDYVVEEGMIGIWHFERWSSGKARAWCRTTSTVSCTTASVGGLYQGRVNINMPSGLFTECENIQVTAGSSTGSGYAFFGRYLYYTTYINLLFFSTASESKDISYSIEIVGKWE